MARWRAGFGAVTGTQRFLLASSFLIALGGFAVLPYMSVLLHQRLGMGLGAVGVVLAVASLLQFSGSVVGAAVAERFGLQRTMLLALAIRTAGFAGFIAGLHWPAAAVAALIVTCCGAALYLPANKAYLVQAIDEHRRPVLLSASNSAINAGIALGPIAAGPFVLDASGALFTAVTVLFAAMTAGHALLPKEKPGDIERSWRVLAGLAVLPFAITVLTLYLHMLFYNYLSVYTVPRTSTVFYGAVLMLHSLGMVVLQPFLAGWIGRLRYRRAMLLGFAAMATGMATLTFGGPIAILAGALVICLGETVLFLKNDLEALARSSRSPAVVFGQQRLAAGIGAFAGGVIGGAGYGALEGTGHAELFWLAVAVQCVLLPPLVLLARRAQNPVRTP